jgi:integrase
MARLPQHVRKIETPRGSRFETRVNSTGRDGTRLQMRKRFTTAGAAVDWHRRTSTALADDAFVARSSLTVKQACEAWLAAKRLRIKPTTYAAYAAAMAPVIQRYGRVPVQAITRADVETLIGELVAGSAGRVPWKRTSINPMLARWRAVWSGLHADGTLPRNVVALVEPLRKLTGELAMKIDDSLTAADADKLLAVHVGHPHEVMLQLALLGLRRGEIGGLRWSAVELESPEPSITVRASRVATPTGTVEQDSVKTASGSRVLPIPAHLLPILRRHAIAQRAMRLAAGNLWQGERNGHVVSLEFGQPPSPRTLGRWWELALQRASLPHRRLHASRHTAASLLNERGASPSTIAAWLGHADGGNLALRVYVHSRNDALTGAATLLNRGT